jgi:uncharacterized protein YndB with AHSA1/START domain
MADAELARFIDRYTVEYIRTYPHPIERVWRAVSEADEIGVWFWRARIDLQVGGAYTFGPDDSDFKGVMQAIEPPRRIRYGGPHPGEESYWEFELEPVAEGTRMVFVQRITPGHNLHPEWPLDPPESPPDTPWRAGTLSGWHRALDSLGDLLDGVKRPHRSDAELADLYRDHMRATLR